MLEDSGFEARTSSIEERFVKLQPHTPDAMVIMRYGTKAASQTPHLRRDDVTHHPGGLSNLRWVPGCAVRFMTSVTV